MSTAIHTILQLGMLYGIATLAVVVSFRFLRFPDLTVDGSFVLGAVVAAVSLRDGATPATAILLAVGSGFLAGHSLLPGIGFLGSIDSLQAS